MIFHSTVPPGTRPETPLPDYLAKRFTYFSRDAWLERIAAGKILRNGKIAGAEVKVAIGDEITYDAGEFDEPPANLDYRIIYDDEWLLGIDKPGNLLVHRAGHSFRNNLIYQLRFVHDPSFPEAHTAHRLDRDTSGAMLVAKNAHVRASLGRMIAAGKMHKTYRAVVVGNPGIREIDLPIHKDASSSVAYKFRVDPMGKVAITRIVACEPIGDNHSLLTLEPVTGRTHQIRIHLAAIGAPIVGDKLYGLSEKEYLKWRDDGETVTLAFHRHALHCEALRFVHPFANEEMVVRTEIHADMRELILRFKKIRGDENGVRRTVPEYSFRGDHADRPL